MKAIATSKGVNATPARDLIFGYLSGIALLFTSPFFHGRGVFRKFLKICNIGIRGKAIYSVTLSLTWNGYLRTKNGKSDSKSVKALKKKCQ